MPDMANIVVKKNDGTTDVTYFKQTPASGDNTPAVWRSTSVGSAPAHAPELRFLAKDAKSGANRAMRGTFKYPQISTNTTTGITSVVDTASAATDWNFPKTMSQADINEFVSQYANLMCSALIKDCVKAGYPAT